MDHTQVIAGVASELHATEKALDDAITHATTLVQAMIGARTALSISPVAGAMSQTKAMEVIAALSTARESAVACHAELQKDHRRLGFGTYAAGPVDKPDEWDSRPMGHQERHLRVA
ncbi:hypothetical protein D8I30_11920 [Brevundimonas naejangsanensis]|uniref:Uncharacterized protein n=1 Tax=Brevundimonas naejangsanensis TaxID=588932 RepID=A0A494RHF3_9CAUL|nr:hypothetical protein [Brevundimonas naejangsanensis]AYG95801.1 hypothetical protein D8I30_11920 [Brevundimonas naejangsanensis]